MTAAGAALALSLACLVSFVLVAVVRAPHDWVSVGPSQPTAEASWDNVTTTPTARPSAASATATGPRATVTGPAAPSASGTGSGGRGGRPSGSTSATADNPVRPTARASTTAAGGGRGPGGGSDAAVVFTDPAPDGDSYVPLPHCPVLRGTARVPAGQRMWFATRYSGEAWYTLLGPADTTRAAPGGRVTWSKLVVLGGAGQYLKGNVIALFLTAEWADYLLSARGFDGRPLIDSTDGDPTGFTTTVLPPKSTAAATLRVRREEGTGPCVTATAGG